MFTSLRIFCFSLIVFSAVHAQAFEANWGEPRRPPGWGRPPRPPPMPPAFPPRPLPPPPPMPGPVAVDVYRFFHPAGDHLFTLNYNEGYAAGYVYEGVAFSLWNDDGRGSRAPLFRCFTGRNHFVSGDWNCQGQIREGLLGFADRQPSGWSPREVVHCSNGLDHLATGDRNECYRAGFQIYEILGYVR